MIQPGVYFAMNSGAGLIGAARERAARSDLEELPGASSLRRTRSTRSAHESRANRRILSRTGGAPTLAVGMASILSSFLGGGPMTGFWYHFVILFEALFILSTVDAGTRALGS